MDDSLCIEIIRNARKLGADDVAVVRRWETQRTDTLCNGAHSFQYAQSDRADFFVHVGGALASCALYDDRLLYSFSDLNAHAADTIHAARMAAAWGTSKKIQSLRAALQHTSAQNDPAVCQSMTPCENHLPKQTDLFRALRSQSNSIDPAPLLPILAERARARFKQLMPSYRQSTYAVRQTFYFNEETLSSDHFETYLDQSLKMDGTSHALRLPTIAFDGLLMCDDGLNAANALNCADIAPKFMRSCLTTSTEQSAPHNITRAILSPWACAVVLHEASHLGASIVASDHFICNYSACLLTPPDAKACRGFAVESVDGNDATDELQAAQQRSFIVDAPSRWVRRNGHYLDVRFEIAATAASKQYEQHFQSLCLRFDLLKMWKTAQIASVASRRITLPCSGGRVTFEVPSLSVDIEGLSQDRSFL